MRELFLGARFPVLHHLSVVLPIRCLPLQLLSIIYRSSCHMYLRAKHQLSRTSQKDTSGKGYKRPTKQRQTWRQIQGKQVRRAVEERDERMCQGCGGEFEEDSDDRQEDWVGCDLCWRWYHYDSAGLSELPEEKDPWTCHKCS